MKNNRLLLCVLTLMLTLLLCMGICAHAEEACEHVVLCTDLTTCSYCGATGITVTEDNIRHQNYTWRSDATQCWSECVDCGLVDIAPAPHQSYCTTPTTCMNCYTENLTIAEENVLHRENKGYLYDENSHWLACFDCTAVLSEADPHVVLCTDPTACSVCKMPMTVSDEDIGHQDWGYTHDDTTHWLYCSACDTVLSEPETHGGNCSTPGVCQTCEGENVTIPDSSFWHTGEQLYDYDGTSHWTYCPECKEILDGPASHYAYCDDQGACAECHMALSDEQFQQIKDSGNFWHAPGRYFESNSETHSEYCSTCSELTNYPTPHTLYCTAPDVCDICGFSGLESTDNNVVHKGDQRYAHDEVSHWHTCDECEAQFSPAAHTAWCNTPDVCMSCGATGLTITGDQLYHVGNYEYDHNATQHWLSCSECSTALDAPTDHTGICSNPSYCEICQYDDCTIENLTHTGPDADIYVDELTHVYSCGGCNTAYSDHQPMEHFSSCMDPDTCAACGAQGVTMAYSSCINTVDFSNDEQHGEVCNDCGSTVWAELHFAYCTDDQYTCYTCGYESADELELYHGESVPEHDDTQHWSRCEDCGEICSELEDHYSYCGTPDVCYICETDELTISEDQIYHEGDNVYDWDADHHWIACSTCDEPTGDSEAHSSRCDSPDVCNICDGTGCNVPEESIAHNGDVEYEYLDDESHVKICAGCTAELSIVYHQRSCQAPDVCFHCGAQNVIFNGTWHSDNTTILADEDAHYNVCDDCEEIIWSEEHYVFCDDAAQNVCSYCSYVGDADASYTIMHAGSTLFFTATHHWVNCNDCGEEYIDMEEHQATCDDPTLCNVCWEADVTITDENISHIWYQDYSYDETYHWFDCEWCDDVNQKEEHSVSPGDTECSICAYPASTVEIIVQPTSQEVLRGRDAAISVVATGDGLTYTWYFKNAGSTRFSRSNSSTSNEYYIPAMTASRDGRQLYCIVKDQYGNECTTDTVTLTMIEPIIITRQPTSIEVPKGQPATVSFAAEGYALTCTWYFKNAGDSSFHKTTSFNGNTYSIPAMTASRDGRQLYCVITDSYGFKVITDTITLTMKETMTITSQPVSVTAEKGQPASVSVAAEGEGLTYTWYFKNAGDSKFHRNTTFTGDTYSVPAMSASRDGRQLYCVITDMYGYSVRTETVTMTMAVAP